VQTIFGEKERPVQVHDASPLRHKHSRSHGQRRRHHASNHNVEATPFGFRRKRQRFGQAAGFVELDVDRIVFAADCLQRSSIVDAFVGADWDRPPDLRQGGVAALR
jgi:hypothetical protein